MVTPLVVVSGCELTERVLILQCSGNGVMVGGLQCAVVSDVGTRTDTVLTELGIGLVIPETTELSLELETVDRLPSS